MHLMSVIHAVFFVMEWIKKICMKPAASIKIKQVLYGKVMAG